MHPRNPYNDAPPDFSKLADDVPALKPFITLNAKGGATIDFKNAESLHALTYALLQRDFGLHLRLPEDRLCPAIPGRLDYVLFLQDLVEADRTMRTVLHLDVPEQIIGLDIGVGASAIYPLLFSRVEEAVVMLGTDVDADSLASARQNVMANQLQSRIQILESSRDGPFFEAALQHASHIDFTMCNPPFYSSADEMEQLAQEKEFSPHAVCTGAPTEMVTAGGETAFIKRMISESKACGSRIAWFSALVGKASSVKDIAGLLAAEECDNYALIELSQGFTQRWVVAWSWAGIRFSDALARQIPPSPLTKSLPLPNSLSYVCKPSISLEDVRRRVSHALAEAAVSWTIDPNNQNISVQAATQSWTRAARRARDRGKGEADAAEVQSASILVCELAVSHLDSEEGPAALRPAQLTCQWQYGKDRQAFQSLFSHLVRKLSSA